MADENHTLEELHWRIVNLERSLEKCVTVEAFRPVQAIVFGLATTVGLAIVAAVLRGVSL